MHSVEFILENEVKTVDFENLSPTTTVLQYLRNLPGRKGTKEGCAEGDCGACTVVLVEMENGKLVYRAVNSCLLFLPALHGKMIITVEDLADGNQLHPIQQAIIDYHASQCGFCTPGIEMSLLALYKENPTPTKQDVEEALAGNLCRCTGYRPIKDAGLSLSGKLTLDKFSQQEDLIKQKLSEIDKSQPLIIEHNGQKYLMPFTIEQALELKKQYPDALVINGSTDVALRVTKRKEKLPLILDLENVEEIRYIKQDADNWIIGAGTKIQDLKNLFKDEIPEFGDYLAHFGAKQIRNRATLGGNIVTASPIGDVIPALFALKAKVRTKSLSGERLIDINEFITGYRTTALNQDELVTEILIPKAQNTLKFYKISKRDHLDISTVSLSASLKVEQGKIEEIVLAYGGMAAQTKRAAQTEEFLTGKEFSLETFEKAGTMLEQDFSPIDDARSSAQARMIIAQNLLIRLFEDTQNI